MSVIKDIITVLVIVLFGITGGEVVERTEGNAIGLKRPIVILYIKFDSQLLSSKMITYLRNRMHVVSEEHNDVLFAVSDSNQFTHKLPDYGFEFDWKRKLEVEPIIIAEDENEVRYLFDSKLTTDSLRSFVQRFKNKELIPQIRSKPIPDNTGKAVKEVVGKTFKEMVIDNPKDIFIMMYAYWCGHCKDTLPIWQKLGERMADEPNVDILQIDVSLNEIHKPFKTLSYPTIYWISADDKYSPKKYLGDRNVYKFIEYIAKIATKPLLKYERDGNRRVDIMPTIDMDSKNEL